MIRFVFVLLLIAPLIAGAQDQEIPTSGIPSLFEVGAGFGAAWFPHYPGSDQERLFALPFPYVVYRGSILRSNREEGTRARFLYGRDYEFSMSADGAIPVSSENNFAREGMPDLGWIFEIGPKFSLKLVDFEDKGSVRFGLAARSVLTSETSWTVEHRGSVFETALDFVRPRFVANVIDLQASMSARWATEPYQSYFYEVAPVYAKAGRPAYSAQGGFLYSTLGLGVSYRTHDEDHRIALMGYVDSLNGSANAGSPLVKSQINTSIAIAYITVFHRSETKADID